MTAFLSDSYLLLIALIITFVSLVLCLYTALLLFNVSKRITGLMSRYVVQPGTTGREQVPAVATSFEENYEQIFVIPSRSFYNYIGNELLERVEWSGFLPLHPEKGGPERQPSL